MKNTPKSFESFPLAFTRIENGPVPDISGLCVDSRQTKPGHLFFGLPGSNAHGATFAKFAIRMGAAAVVTDAAGYDILVAEGQTLPIIITEDPRLALAHAAAFWFEDQPETIVAVTGTNGKTSVASFTRQIWEELDLNAVNFGTAGVEGAVCAPLAHTTPEPITLHKLLAELFAQNVTHAAMEASSHGLDQRRLDGVRLAAGGFTNLSRDHLDYHPSFAAYFEAKAALFHRLLPNGASAVINIDDSHGADLFAAMEGKRPRLSIGRDASADIRILDQRFRANGQDVLIAYKGENRMLHLNLIGGFQSENVLLAAGLVIETGADADAVLKCLPALKTVRGRMEHVATRTNGAMVFVDFAHTPDALETALQAMRPHVMGRLILVFGAGGDRDKGKRPLMGTAAEKYADLVYVTDDNPRSETPADIRSDILAACQNATEIGDRAEAILTAVDALQPGDALLIAGKGHETGQIVGSDILEFNDAEQASIAVAALEELKR